MTDLAVMLMNRKGVAKDDVEAARLLRKAGDVGNARALYILGFLYAQGRGEPRTRRRPRGSTGKAPISATPAP